MLRIIARNVVSNWVGYAVNACVIFLLTPFVLRSLGDTRYGVWILINGLTGYFGLLDLGMRLGTTRYLTRNLAQRDYLALNRTASTSVVALGTCGFVVLLASAVLSWLSPRIFAIPEDTIYEVRWCTVVIGITMAAQFPLGPYTAVFAATQRYDLVNAIAIPLRLASAGGTYVALQLGYGLPGLCVVSATADTLGYIVRARVAHRILPQLDISLWMVAWRDFREILSYGMLNSLVQGASILKDYSSSLIIALCMPVAALAPFNLAAGLVMQVNRLFTPMAIVFFPLATQLDAKGDLGTLRRMYFSVSRVFLSAAVAVAVIAAIWAADFYRLWVGSKFVDGNEYTSVVVLFWVLMAAGTVQIGQKIAHQILLGCHAMGVLAVMTLAEAIGTVALMVPLILLFGLLGVVLATLIPVVIVQGVVFPVAVCRVIQARPMDYIRAAYVRPCLLPVLLTPPLLLLHHAIPVQGSWLMLAFSGVLAAGVAIPLLLLVGLDSRERQRITLGALRRMTIRRNRTEAMEPPLLSSRDS